MWGIDSSHHFTFRKISLATTSAAEPFGFQVFRNETLLVEAHKYTQNTLSILGEQHKGWLLGKRQVVYESGEVEIKLGPHELFIQLVRWLAAVHICLLVKTLYTYFHKCSLCLTFHILCRIINFQLFSGGYESNRQC